MEIRRKRNAKEDLLNKRIGTPNSLTFTLWTVLAVLMAPDCTPLSSHPQETRPYGSKRALILYLYNHHSLIIPLITPTLMILKFESQRITHPSSKMFHPIFATVYPSIFVRGRVQTSVLIHSWINEMLNDIKSTSVNFPLIPL